MTFRAYVATDIVGRGVAIDLVRHIGEDLVDVAEPLTVAFRREVPTSADVVTSPMLRLPEEAARALLDALAAHFGGTSEVQTLRKDYIAERARVDKMLEFVMCPRMVVTNP